MNFTVSSAPTISLLNSTTSTTTTVIESWFIPLDICMTICTILVIIFACLFLLIIILDKTCHTVAMMIIANSCLSILVLGCSLFSLSLFTLGNDLQRIRHQDVLCVFRAYIFYSSCSLIMFSFVLQAFYRYILVVYPTRFLWQSARFQVLLICTTWIFSFLYALAYIFTNEIIYNADNQICQMPLRLSLLLIYGAHCTYIIPVSMIMFMYVKLALYVKAMRQRLTIMNKLFRARRDLKAVQRTAILIAIIMIVGIPYGVFIFISFFTTPPKYHFRIAFACIDASLVLVMITLFQFTNPLKTSIMKRMNMRPNTIVAARMT